MNGEQTIIDIAARFDLSDQSAQAIFLLGLEATGYDLSELYDVGVSIFNNAGDLDARLQDMVYQLGVRWRPIWKRYCQVHDLPYPRIWRDDLPQELPVLLGSITPKKWRELCRYYHDRCLACGSPRNLSMDHIDPLGPRDDIQNVQPLCRTCNSRKCDGAYDYRPGGSPFGRRSRVRGPR